MRLAALLGAAAAGYLAAAARRPIIEPARTAFIVETPALLRADLCDCGHRGWYHDPDLGCILTGCACRRLGCRCSGIHPPRPPR